MKRSSLLGLLALAACAEALAPPTPLCACSPPHPFALVSGVLTRAGGEPVRGARVQFVAGNPAAASAVSASTLTDSTGFYRVHANALVADSVWVHIFVHDTTLGTIKRPVPDSVRLRFRWGEAVDSIALPLTYVP